MAVVAIERGASHARRGAAELLAAVSGALLVLLAVAVAFASALDSVGRTLLGTTLIGPEQHGLIERAGLVFAAISVLALPAAVSAGAGRSGRPRFRLYPRLRLCYRNRGGGRRACAPAAGARWSCLDGARARRI